MGEEEEKRNRSISISSSSSSSRAMESLSLEINRYPKDLLQRFTMSNNDMQKLKQEEQDDDAEEEIELNLGLSLGGRFGVDKTSSQKLTRSTSVAGSLFPMVKEVQAGVSSSYPLLKRTSSLPTETEEEWRKRKEMQTLRRLEAKRRRSEKQKNLNVEDDRKGFRGNWVAPTWNRNVNRSHTLQGLVGSQQQQGSQGSVESQGGASDISELERTSSGGEARSPASTQSLQDRSAQDLVGSSGSKPNENIYRTCSMENGMKKLDSAETRGASSNSGEDMPCVFTIGDGPNGRKVDGILYKYGKGEEVRIMCVCHGSFLSPAEFVKHAGGRDVDHPLRHIVVNTSATSFL
ncbi:ninja-family protein AFP1-like isoform X2 [Mercurialis annua]|uniref:ninja-family protein AFP1-like isoform X2 n=1 Tax=Mercurialis annua TaxID=3986 RepID=UPI00215E299B|nr:ninja-family protein AFP1-like isoform X2 [Mercurialis annua]